MLSRAMAGHAPYVQSGRRGAAWLLPFVGVAAAAIAACLYAHAAAALAPTTVTSSLGGKLLTAGSAVLRILMCPALGIVVAVPVALAGLPLRVRSAVAMRHH